MYVMENGTFPTETYAAVVSIKYIQSINIGRRNLHNHIDHLISLYTVIKINMIFFSKGRENKS